MFSFPLVDPPFNFIVACSVVCKKIQNKRSLNISFLLFLWGIIQTFLRQKVTLGSSNPTSEATQENTSKAKSCAKENKTECEGVEGDEKLDVLQESEKRCLKSSKECNGGSGALRYALHLRFICPSPKKASKKPDNDDTTGGQKKSLDSDGKRRFYLYNDLRVVFPQRHTDSDEGKVPFEILPSDS